MPPKPATTVSSSPEYHHCKRQRSDLIIIKDVPLAPASFDEVLPQLFANVGNMHLDQIGKRVVVLVENVLVNPGPRHQFAALQREQFKDGELPRRQLDRHTAA